MVAAALIGRTTKIFHEHVNELDLDFYFNPESVDPTESARVRSVLMDALKALEQGNVSAEAPKQTGSPPPYV